ncbi:SPFH domain-containing protein [Mycoplasmopsis ciconiae]|uniref:SPFH domain-containing protein n=1 Tax=Mycoplasmopsis ciconiae TaxID=561067 RepID=A0ABU7MM70_9BACT|nr:SPFH domain-containing protein [Mycoplasmopsis ciconiae]
MSNLYYLLLLIPLFFIVILFLLSIKVVNEREFYVVQRFGKYHKTLLKGINFIFPIIDKIYKKENLKEKVFDFPAQSVITKDNATIKIDTVVYLKIVDPKLFAYGAERPIFAIENLTATTLRNVIGELELDEALTSREIINTKLTKILDEASDAWGIKVNRVELQNIIPPSEVQEAMIRQMQAERIKRAQILESEGIKQSQILKAQGEKESLILKAQGEKEALILEAEAKKKSIELVANSNLNPEYLKYLSILQIKELANGHATKIILPPNLNDITSVMTAGSAIYSEIKDKTNDKKTE